MFPDGSTKANVADPDANCALSTIYTVELNWHKDTHQSGRTAITLTGIVSIQPHSP